MFAARSGTGKSTTARRLCPPCTPLSDDQCILLPWRVLEPGRDCAGWACIDVRPGESLPVPLAAVHLLERGDRTEVAPLPRSEAFRRLLSHAVLIPAETETHAALLGAAGELLADVPVTIARVCLGDLSPATLGWPDSPAGPGQEAGIG
ncbi:MAG: hypothetical protein FJ109_05570 [Deltaproteobacteria bacterium]|nr:hypothetical protein [Deltaproteobacteria bacterium]